MYKGGRAEHKECECYYGRRVLDDNFNLRLTRRSSDFLLLICFSFLFLYHPDYFEWAPFWPAWMYCYVAREEDARALTGAE